MAASIVIEEESGSYSAAASGPVREHNGYYAGDFSALGSRSTTPPHLSSSASRLTAPHGRPAR